jgi:hypothetical protein
MSHQEPQRISEGLLGQKYAFATASLVLGITSFIHFLGMEKAILAILFGMLALRSPSTRLRRSWAIAGIVLGCIMLLIVLFAIVFYHQELTALIEYLKKFG